MAKLKPWYDVVELREDLRENRPLDASEFAVHLDQIRDGRAPKDYTDPERFFRPPYVGPRGWIGVRIDRRLDWAVVAALVEQAYRHVAPPRLREAVGAAAPSAPGDPRSGQRRRRR